jgi:hypothetical protein
LYGPKFDFLNLREENTVFRNFQNKMLRKRHGLNREEMTEYNRGKKGEAHRTCRRHEKILKILVEKYEGM